jgi:hypothetical protein
LYGRYTSQSISSNTTTVEYQIRHYIPVGGVTYWSSSQRFTGDITNSSSNAQNQSFGAGETTLLTATKTITHNNDGTKNISVGASFTNSFFGNTVSISNVTVTLPRIARASSVSSSSPYIGDVATIVIASASTSFTHTLSYAFGNATGTIVTKTSATTVAWDTSYLKSTLYAQIPNAKSGSGTITCQTYSGNTLIGTKTTNFNLYAKESECKPDISGTVVDTNEATITLTDDSSKLVRYMSKPKVTISASANYSASIKSYSINVDGKTINLSEATFETITSNNITISVVDSRGYSSSKVLTPTMINYIKLTSNLSITRPEQTSNEARLNGDGQWFNGNFSDINTNTLTITCQYRKSGDEEWINLNQLTPNINNNYFNFNNVLIGDTFDYKEEYQFKIIITDELDTIGNSNKDIIILSVGMPVLRIGKNDVFVKMKPIDASVSVNSTEPTKGQDIWIDDVNKKIYTRNDNGVYEEFNNAIVDSGNNANGDWIKFADGTLIQRGIIDKTKFLNTGSSLSTAVQGLNIYRSEIAEITLPQKFIDDTYSLTPQVRNSSGGSRTTWVRTHDKSNNSFSLQLTGLENFTSSAIGYTTLNNIDWIAIGRWK